MGVPAIAVTEEQLRAAHRELQDAVSFEVMQACPALLLCLHNIAEINARRRAAPVQSLDRPRSRSSRDRFDPKRAAANDFD